MVASGLLWFVGKECALLICSRYDGLFAGVFAYDVRAEIVKVTESRKEIQESTTCSSTDTSENA